MSQQSLPPPAAPPPPPVVPPPPSPEDRVGARWMPTDPILGIVGAVVLVTLLGSVAVAFTGEEGLDTVIALQAALEVGLIVTALIFAAMRGIGGGALKALGLRAPGPGAWSAAAKTFGLYLLGAFLYGLIIGPPEQRDLADELGFNTGVAGAIVAGLAIVVVAPFAEEIFFRGFLFGSLRDLTSLWPAALGSGFFFGIIHLSTGELSVVPPLVYLGVLLALLYARTGSIWPCIAVHTFNNALAFTLLVAT